MKNISNIEIKKGSQNKELSLKLIFKIKKYKNKMENDKNELNLKKFLIL